MSNSAPSQATVVRVDARQCDVLPDGHQEACGAHVRGRIYADRGSDKVPVAVGDRVLLSPSSEGFVIDEVLPRRNIFCRRAAGEDSRRQLLATNVDQVVLVACFGTPPFSSMTTDRILAAASFSDIPVAVVLNKTDRAKPQKIEKIAATYRNLGIPLLLTSAAQEIGIEEFKSLLKGKISVLYGLSGVGKSSLLNLVETGLGLRTREVSAGLKSGRHTTTYARLYPLPVGGSVVDTPGVRVFRPYGIPPLELRLHFPELASAGKSCHYSSCCHRGEPGCVVPEAIAQGRIAPSRHRTYLVLLEELEAEYGPT
jgi:ribosome biogenesis GTPase / thiamine phosphate phosphatase